jgi:hypothetical protein
MGSRQGAKSAEKEFYAERYVLAGIQWRVVRLDERFRVNVMVEVVIALKSVAKITNAPSKRNRLGALSVLAKETLDLSAVLQTTGPCRIPAPLPGVLSTRVVRW